MPDRRVVITGLGVLSALGPDAASFWDALRKGRHGFRPIQAVDTSTFRLGNAAELPDYDEADHFDRRSAAMLDPFAQYAVIAAREAVTDSGIAWTSALQQRTGIVAGSASGGVQTQQEGYHTLYVEGKTRVHPLSVPRVMTNAGASHIAMEFGLQGPAYAVASACSSANHAIGQAFWMIRNGVIDLALAGGSEAPFNYGNLRAWEAMRVVAPDVCRPFSKDRPGMMLGEGGAMLVLETLGHARARGAHIYAELVGFGMTADAHHLTQPLADGAARAMQMALDDAGLTPEAVGYINAHGTGTAANDAMETEAIRTVFGSHADRLAVSSTKSMHGHALGAAGALEGAATVLALQGGVLPPTANYTEPDPACDLDVIPNEARPAVVEVALSNSFAFGGLNAVLAFRRWDG